MVLVAGEAGVGKTVLLKRFCDHHSQSARILWGACDALLTPGPLEPLFDIAEVTGGEIEKLVGSAARPHEVVAALLRELRGGRLTIVVLEDLHWADEATLDVLSLLGRRIGAAPALVVASYRDDELDHEHPLRIVVGELATREAVERLRLEPLTPAAVARLAAPHGVDAEELHRTTGGNPFFATEVLAASGKGIPATVRDAVLARAARLEPAARRLLEAAAIVPQRADVWLLRALAGDDAGSLEACIASGMLTSDAGGVSFRHELARLTVAETLPPDRSASLHAAALAALGDPPVGASDAARLAHHAEAAGDGEAVLVHALLAAERAAALGAHRESAAQYERALRFADGAPPKLRAELLERLAHECYLVDRLDAAVEAQEAALALRRELGDPVREGDCLRALGRLLGFAGRAQDAAPVAREAITVLQPLHPGPDLARAYASMAQLRVNVEDLDGAVKWGERALELAEALDRPEIVVYALTTVGAAGLRRGAGTEALERSLGLARSLGLEDEVGRVYANLVWVLTRQRAHALATGYLDDGLEYATERGLDYWMCILHGCRARSELDQGRWTEAADTAALVLRDPRSAPVPRVLALVARALVRARRGDPEVWPLLEEAIARANPTTELQQMAPAAAARAEVAWLEGRAAAAIEATDRAFELALSQEPSWELGELACWRRRAGAEIELLAELPAPPYAAELVGDHARAAELWTALGCRYEAAVALGQSDDESELRRALEELQALSAQPAAAVVARRLRERGARGLPRGPRPTTMKNPAGLTARELEVLELVSAGLRNSEIAQRLFLSEKTVGHHVSAILRKLDVRTRGEASAEAARLGLAGQDR
jgi:DNA-binding NarL/FixJ family response regulator